MVRRKAPQPSSTTGDPGEALALIPFDTPEGREQILSLLPSISGHDAFLHEVLKVAHWLNQELHERTQNDPRATRKRLSLLKSTLDAACGALQDLGAEAELALFRRAECEARRTRGNRDETIWHRLELDGMPTSGAARVQWIIQALMDCARWAAEAEVNIAVSKVVILPPDPDIPNSQRQRMGGGRPRDAAAEEAMRSLIDIWTFQTGRRPTITTDPITGRKKKEKPFLAFCEAVITPIYKAYGLRPPSMGVLAQKMLYLSEFKP